MAIFDKVKEQAEKARQQAVELKDRVGDKVEDVQAKRKADDLLEELGRLVYAQRTDRANDGAGPEIERIVGEVRQLEDAGVPILTQP